MTMMSSENLDTPQERTAFRIGYWTAIILSVIALIVFMTSGGVWAQSRPGAGGFSAPGLGDMNSLYAGFRFVLRIVVVAVPLLLLSYYTWKMKPKDLYEIAWVAIGWCAIAYIIG
jgi:heme/copper-type cytochrome/quinol oxidase subunit 4